MHLLAIITLYISAVSFGSLLFQYVNRWFPDLLTDYAAGISGAIRWAIASLIIVFPVYAWLSRTLARDVATNPAKREIRIRKWLLYFTLFLAAVVIIGDLIALIFNFLGGDLTTRFVLKIFVVFAIAAAVFWYYLKNLRSGAESVSGSRMRVFIISVIAIVAIATVGGFFIVGSPFAERMRRFDEQRVSNLQEIQWQIINYWQRKDKLPAVLDDLRDPISGFTVPTDPETAAAYAYRVTTKLQFELCADFKTANTGKDGMTPRAISPVGAPGTVPENWAHGTGRVCFERTIDPQLYKLPKSAP